MQNEIITKWQSHKHPEDANFMQVVCYLHVQYADGRQHLYWNLKNSAANDKYIIPNISLSEAEAKYKDKPVEEVTEREFLQWLKDNGKA